MDIREKIIDTLHKHYYPTMHESIADCTLIECADEVLALIREAGYRKIGGEPPVLSDEKIKEAYLGNDYHPTFKFGIGMRHSLERVAQAQCDADMRFYDNILAG